MHFLAYFGLSKIMCPVPERCHAGALAKDFGKIALTGESQYGGNLRWAIVGVNEHVFGRIDFPGLDIFTDGSPGFFFKQSGEIGRV